ncbi:MAG TPA: hypothetical protein DCW29_16045 [Janthinobacterium sp.]|nr:hypothetical protein [Janthinobacterium sp.]
MIQVSVLALALSACGGGAGSGAATACASGLTSACPAPATSGTSTGTTGTGATTPVALATLALALSDSGGAASTAISPDLPATLQATVKDAKGNAVANTAVTFLSTDKSASFLPPSGTALTDAKGLARVTLAAGTQAGAFTVTASAAVGDAAPKGTVSYAVGFPALTLSELQIAPATLSANGGASIVVTVMNGAAPYGPPVAVTFSSPCVLAGKASIASPVLTQNGVASATYSDKGCAGTDLLTASLAAPYPLASKSGSLSVLASAAGSIKFLSADPGNIALKGSGGFGRVEFATLTFKVYDTNGIAAAGKQVDFSFANGNATLGIGGLSLSPASATTDAGGNATTLVTAGTIPTSVRVLATIHGSAPAVTTLSNILAVSTGIPDQNHFSLASSIGNCEGLDFDGFCSVISATLGDHFGNPVPDGTAVNFSTEAGIIDASCVTGSLPDPGVPAASLTTNSKVGPGSGVCSVNLRASGVRPPNGRVTVLAYAVGEENFFDANGNNVYEASEPFSDRSPDVYRDDNEDGVWSPGEPCVGPNSNGACSTSGDGQYNGVLRNPQVPSPQTLYVSQQLVQTFSGSEATISFTPSVVSCGAGLSTDVQVKLSDRKGNIMPAGTTISFAAMQAGGFATVFPTSLTVANVPLLVGETRPVPAYAVTLTCGSGGSGKIFVTVSSPLTHTVTNASIPFN